MNFTFLPDDATVNRSQLTQFIGFCSHRTGRTFDSYWSFEDFSVTEYEQFWRLFAEWSNILPLEELDPVCAGSSCEEAVFFPGAHLNYAEVLLRGEANLPAITVCHGDGRVNRLTRGELRAEVARFARWLSQEGVKKGDRIVAVARNGAEIATAALAAAAIGASFSSAGLDMKPAAILARFAQLEPAVLIGNIRSESWEIDGGVAELFAAVAAGLPSLRTLVALDDGRPPLPLPLPLPLHGFSKVIAEPDGANAEWSRHSFNHPLFILFSSGTTGSPKCIVHGAGGTLLEHVKEHRLHCDLRPGDKLFYQTSPGWMMWNWQLSALASGCELVLYDGPLRGPETMWQIVASENVTVFGTSAAYLQYCEMREFKLGVINKFTALRSVLSTGSILYPRQFDWVLHHVKSLPLQSISGGTDMIGCFVLGNPNLPVHRGQAQCRSLGLDVRALRQSADEAGPGELICANPFPSRPLGFYADQDRQRYHKAYFSQNDGVWTHGDLIEFTPEHGIVLHGRSDGVMNIRGVRIGPAEIYSILQEIEELAEALAVEQYAADEPGGARMVLLVVLRKPAELDAALVNRIRKVLLTRGSANLAPSRIAKVEALPITHNGKRSEAAARDALNGREVRNRDALQNPECLVEIAKLAREQTQTDQEEKSLTSRIQNACETALGLSPIGRFDNLFELAGDSLRTLSLTIALEECLQRPITLEALVAAPTIDALTSTNIPDLQEPEHLIPRVRTITSDDVDDVCCFLANHFVDSKISVDSWRSLFDTKWITKDLPPGFVLTVAEQIVGVIGTLYAERKINGRAGLVCNLSSWYVVPEYRKWSTLLIASATSNKEVTYTALTPSNVTGKVLALMNFEPLATHAFFLPPGFQIGALLRKVDIELDKNEISASLHGLEKQIFDDHDDTDCLHLLARAGTARIYIVVKKRILGRNRLGVGVAVSHILYCSEPELMTQYIERIKLTVMVHQHTFGLVVNEGFFKKPPRGIRINFMALFRSTTFVSGDIDLLYSELAILKI